MAGWEVTGLDGGGVLRGAYARWIFKTLTLNSSHKTQKVARFTGEAMMHYRKNKENLYI